MGSTSRGNDRALWTAAFASVTLALAGCGGTAESGADGLVPCGGELTGSWVGLDQHVTTPPNPNVNACWNLVGAFSSGMYSASSRYPTPDQRLTQLRFAADGSYTLGQVRSGPVTVDYAADCLVTEQGTPTCTELQDALVVSGLGEGSYRDAMCTDRAGGGCSCTVQVSEVRGRAGSWQSASLTSVTLTNPAGDPEPTSMTVGYCVNASGLRFDAAVDHGVPPFWPQTSDVTFSPPDCNGTAEQLRAKYGPDCAFVCDTAVCGGSLK